MKKKTISQGIILGDYFCPDLRLYYFNLEIRIPGGLGVYHTTRAHPLIFIITHGCGTFSNGTGTFQAQRGECFALFPDEDLSWEADLQNPWEYLCLEITGQDACPALAKLGFTAEQPVFSFQNADYAVQAAMELHEQLTLHRYEPFALQAALCRWLSFLENARRGREGRQDVVRAQKYIDAYYRQPVTVAGIAEMLSLNRSHFSRIFRRETGQTVQEYLIRRRLEAAKQLLLDSDHTVAQIAESAGFPSAAALSEAFRKREGYSPSAFRAHNRF